MVKELLDWHKWDTVKICNNLISILIILCQAAKKVALHIYRPPNSRIECVTANKMAHLPELFELLVSVGV